jgi:branched-chain amino acid transport system substrate-binding protein
MTRRSAAALAAFLALSALGIAATPARSQGAAAAPAAARISDGVVRIGLLLDLSGPYADNTGKASVAAAQMAIDDFGGKVLGAPIQLVVADPMNSPNRAAELARNWFGPGHVDAVMDVSGSSEALIVQAIGHTRDKIVSLSAPLAVRLTNRGCSPTGIHYTMDTYAIAHTIAPAIVKMGGKSWFFITVDNDFGYDLERNTAAVVAESGGTVLGHARHPLNAPDFISYLDQARESHAQVIAVANAGSDTLDTIRTAAKVHMLPGGQIIAGLTLHANAINTLGLPLTQGMILADAFYWDMNDATRAWSKRFFARVGQMPNSFQAGLYSSITHYLQAIARTGTDATDPVINAMRAAPINDFFAHDGHIRGDGLMVHDMYLFRVKTPAESHSAWDVEKLVATVPAAQAFQPLSESKCALVRPQTE